MANHQELEASIVPGLKPSARLKVLVLPPISWAATRSSFRPGIASDPFELERYLLADDIEVTTINPGHWPINPFGNAHSLLRALDPWRALRVLLTERHHDLVVAVMGGPAVPLMMFRRMMRFSTPIVQWDIAPSDHWRLRSRMNDFVIPRLDGMMVLASMQPGYIASRWGGDVPIRVVGHYVDTNFYQPTNSCQPTNFHRPGGEAADDGSILAVGEDIGRDFPTLLQAIVKLPVTLVLRTSQTQPAAATRLPNLRLIRDRVSEAALRALYAEARFVVVPLSDTLNACGVSTILEAGAMGKATIVSASAATDDFVIANETCLRVPCHDPVALRAAIERLLNEPETCERLGRNARRFVVEHCSRPAFATRFAAALRSFARPG